METPTDASPAEPDIGHVNPAAAATWFGHPRQLARLFTTEMWERFGFYGMRALLTLYIAKHFLFNDQTTNALYGGFTALVYLTPLVGGLLADRYLGSKKSVKFGAILMSLGYFVLCFGGEPARPYAMIEGHRYEVTIEKQGAAETQYIVDHGRKLAVKGNEDGSVGLVAADGHVAHTIAKGGFTGDGERSIFYTMLMLAGLSMITVGNGFFKPNISTMVGTLYAIGDRRRDAGFTIFYMGINLGSFFSQLLCPLLAVGMGSWAGIGWWAGFGLAAIGMLCSFALIQFDGGALDGYGEPPPGQTSDRSIPIFVGAIVAVPVAWLLFYNLMGTVPAQAGSGLWAHLAALPLMSQLLYAIFLLSVPAILLWSFVRGSRAEFQMMVAATVMIVFNVVFWTLFEQAGSSLTLFADRNTDLSIFGLFSMNAGQTQFFNAAFIILFAPVLSILWTWAAARGVEPSTPVKFSLALIGVGAGFLFLVWGASMVGPSYRLAVWWLAGLYLFHSIAELCISPVGLSMVTKLSIARVVGFMMGLWFLSISVAQSLAGLIAQAASVETVGGQVTNLRVSLETYVAIYQRFGLYTIAVGVVLLALSPLIKKWMHGVR